MQTCAGGATLIMKGAARLMKDASPTPTNLQSCLAGLLQCIIVSLFV